MYRGTHEQLCLLPRSSTAAVEVAVALKSAEGKPMSSWISPQVCALADH
jgi:hypothetical protein